MDALLLLLLDSRAPAGGHSHSGGMEPAVDAGLVRGMTDVEDFCRGRLRTAGRVAADAAGLACALALDPGADAGLEFALLDAEMDARMPSEAVRNSSRQLGRGLLRLARWMLPGFAADRLVGMHHPVVLGAAVAAAGGTPDLAATSAALTTVTAPASAAVRLLGLDPFAVQAMLATLAAEIDTDGWTLPVSIAKIAADCAPVLDLLADIHLTAEVRLFAS